MAISQLRHAGADEEERLHEGSSRLNTCKTNASLVQIPSAKYMSCDVQNAIIDFT